MRFIWLKSSFLQKNTLYLGINNLKTKRHGLFTPKQ